jgi:hypothetical protein
MHRGWREIRTLVRFEGCYDAASSPAPGPGPASASSAGASAPFSSSSPAAGHFAVALRLISTISTELAALRWRPMRSQQPHAEVAALEILATARGSACLPHAWTRGRRLGRIPGARAWSPTRRIDISFFMKKRRWVWDSILAAGLKKPLGKPRFTVVTGLTGPDRFRSGPIRYSPNSNLKFKKKC